MRQLIVMFQHSLIKIHLVLIVTKTQTDIGFVTLIAKPVELTPL